MDHLKAHKNEKFRLPDARLILKFDDEEIEAGLIHISTDGLLCEVIHGAKPFDFQKPVFGSLFVKAREGYLSTEDLFCKVTNIQMIGYQKDYYPSYVQIEYAFVGPSEKQRVQLNMMLKTGTKI